MAKYKGPARPISLDRDPFPDRWLVGPFVAAAVVAAFILFMGW